ncbi:S8 family serine peptidase [Flavobacterium caeni]|uniref:Por secretion system C-terminal sorting domain-containing protein n=1 Tax=Flavobacterium caeni TaxID=490189 RepID=A0A1G5DWN4_9FLAO|nr:S8 family serine peptidase [Flavobacterium caeni]SCY19172.1 Por secretion system C-terminal sorting domain-containing protein [Flavobacterium caeni]
MKNTTAITLKTIGFLLLPALLFQAFAQDAKQIKQITKNYDLVALAKLQKELALEAKLQKAKAIEAARINGWPILRPNANGEFDELMAVTDDGKPIYYVLDNVNAAKSTRANHLHTGGTLGLNLNGQGMFSGVWDGGTTRISHQEFGGRATVNDVAGTLSAHATHVSGTVAASGVQANAKGMAPQSTLHTYDWNSDTAEVTAEAANGLLLSNHSYGVPVESAPGSWFMGAYSGAARIVDQIAYNAPYYLMVLSAGNDGNENNPSPMTPGYDKLTGNKTAKNNLVVANSQDANVDAQGNLLSVSINSSSSEGPTDDRRIKPDIAGNGSGLTSSTSNSNSSYGSMSGTSMASPNVMGTLILVQQHYNNVNNRFMKSATLKGLACHTADDRGKVGPDPVWGWGLLNAKKAAQTISQNGLQSWISEETLQQDQTFSFTAVSDGTTPLLASICWTDVPGTANNGTLNSTTPALVNDLDIRVTKDGSTFYPWKLLSDANQAAIATEDNSVDNVERININTPEAGAYTITVTHKGTLVNGPQDFAFVVTGLSSAFSMTSLSDEQTACLDGSANFDFAFTNAGATATTFTANGLPNGASVSFSPATMNASGNFTMTVSNLQNAVPGIYPVSVIGNNGSETETRTVILKVSSTDFADVVALAPGNGQVGVATSLDLTWNAIDNADTYHVQVATDAAFNDIVSDGTTDTASYTVSGLDEATYYYWRVYPVNSCGEGTVATAQNFQTGELVCNNSFEPMDYNNATISDQFSSIAVLQFPVTGDMTVGDINVELDITHTYIGDLTVTLEGTFETGFPRVILLQEPCGDSQGIDCTVDDAGVAVSCTNQVPALTGSVRTFEQLSFFNNKPANGVWTIYVSDPHPGDGGVVNFAKINFCTVQPALGVKENNAIDFGVFPNPTTGVVNVKRNGHLSGETNLTLFDLQGRQILEKSNIAQSETLHLDHLQNGVYLLSIENGKHKTTKKVVLNR